MRHPRLLAFKRLELITHWLWACLPMILSTTSRFVLFGAQSEACARDKQRQPAQPDAIEKQRVPLKGTARVFECHCQTKVKKNTQHRSEHRDQTQAKSRKAPTP